MTSDAASTDVSLQVKQMLHQYHKKEAGDDDDADVHIEEKSGEGDGEDEEAPPFWIRSNFEGSVLVCSNGTKCTI